MLTSTQLPPTSSSSSNLAWVDNSLDPAKNKDASLMMAASMMVVTMVLNQFAQVQGKQIEFLNGKIAQLTKAIDLLRTYTPPANKTLDKTLAPWTNQTANADLYTIMETLTLYGFNGDKAFVGSDGKMWPAYMVTWTEAQTSDAGNFTIEKMNGAISNLQGVSTKFTTDVQTVTAQASQTIQTSNAISTAVASMLANFLQMCLSGAKA